MRGVTIVFMIMVNNNGGPSAWSQMEHAEWNGLRPPTRLSHFLFVVGASIVFAYQARLAKRSHARPVGLAHGKTRPHPVPARHLRQRLSILPSRPNALLRSPAKNRICYLAVGLFYLWDKRLWTKVAALAVTLVGYWVLVQWVPVPGAGLPGRDIPFLDKDLNIVASLDRQLMPNHLYEDFTSHDLRDPEGLLSDIPAIGTTLLACSPVYGCVRQRGVKSKALGLVPPPLACLASGYFWSIWFPLNKKMWTSSYVLVRLAGRLRCLHSLFWAVEIKGWGKARGAEKSQAISRGSPWPWLVFGSNAIAAYMVSELLQDLLVSFPLPRAERKWTQFGGSRTFSLTDP